MDNKNIGFDKPMTRKEIEKAKKNFEKATGVPYDIRVKNLEDGEDNY